MIAPRFVPRLINFALAEADTNSNPTWLTRRYIKIVPVPGPKKPSYRPASPVTAMIAPGVLLAVAVLSGPSTRKLIILSAATATMIDMRGRK
jgi:hypothetical protein